VAEGFQAAVFGDKHEVSVQTRQWTMPTPLGKGSVLAGRYRLQRLLGRGGMADVYLAQDAVLGRPVAVKVFPAGTSSDPDAKRRQHEAELLASLNHPGLVTVFDAGVDPDQDRSFLVMEFVGGPTLAGRLASGPLGEALAFVHERGVVHRDVKPSNVLFADAADRQGVKLADFGIARMADSARLTQAGLIVGSAHYLSPEQARGAEAGPPSDVYALGLVLLECLTGEPAFPGAGIAAAAARLHSDPPIPAAVDPDLRRLLTAMTSREPAQRPTAQEVATGLSGVSGIMPPFLEVISQPGSTTASLPAAAIAATRSSWVRRRGWVAAAGAAVIVALAGSAALLAHAPTPDQAGTVVQSPASPDADQVAPASPTSTPSAPAVQPLAQPGATAERDGDNEGASLGPGDGAGDENANGNGKAKGNGKGGKGNDD
jgi:eukaryotic-like serine/threonine-protein kinase